VLEIDAAQKFADDGHQHVLDEGVDDFLEGTADDDADRQVDDIALHGEFLEFLNKAHGFSFERVIKRGKNMTTHRPGKGPGVSAAMIGPRQPLIRA
jgi:hypothetical protein